MLGHTHMAYGAMFGALAVHFGYADASIAFFLGTQIGCLSPDIDHPKAMISKGTTSLIGKSGLFSHRGFTHSIEGIICGYLIMLYALPYVSHFLYDSVIWIVGSDSVVGGSFIDIISWTKVHAGTGFAWGFLLGAISHSFIDLFNKPGILLSSLFNYRFTMIGSVTRIGTGSIAELIFMISGVIITFAIDIYTGIMGLAVGIIFWLLIGKPGFPKFRM